MDKSKSLSFELAKQFLCKEIDIVIDRPLGSRHPKYPDHVYEVNSGFVPGVIAPDGKELDAHYLGSDKPLEKASGVVIAIIHRLEDDDDKLIVVPMGVTMTDAEIEAKVHFQEKYYKHIIVRNELN